MTGTSRLVKNFASLAASRFIARATNAVFAFVAARLLGVERLGLYATVTTFLFFATTLGRLGIERVIVRDVAQDKTQADHFLSSAVALSLALSIPMLVGLPSLAGLLGYSLEVRSLLWIVGVVVVGHAIARPSEALLLAFEEMPVLGAIRAIMEIGSTAVGLLVLFFRADVTILVWVLAIFVWIEAILLLGAIHRTSVPLRWKPTRTTVQWLVRGGAPLFLLTGINLVVARVDILLMARINGTQAVGLYAPGVSLIRASALIRTSLVAALFPVLAVRWKEAPQTLGRTYGRVLRLFAIYGIGVAISVTFISETLYQLLLGADYLAGARALRVLSWAMVGDVLAGPAMAMIIIVREKLPRYIPIAAMLMFLNVVLNLILLPRYSYMGAAWATLVTSFVALAVQQWWIRGVFGAQSPSLVGGAWRPVLAGLAMVAVSLAMRPINIWLATFVAAIVYLIALIAVRAFTKEELRWAQDTITSRLGIAGRSR